MQGLLGISQGVCVSKSTCECACACVCHYFWVLFTPLIGSPPVVNISAHTAMPTFLGLSHPQACLTMSPLGRGDIGYWQTDYIHENVGIQHFIGSYIRALMWLALLLLSEAYKCGNETIAAFNKLHLPYRGIEAEVRFLCAFLKVKSEYGGWGTENFC